MPDPRFFQKSRDYKLGELADLTGAELSEGSNPDQAVEDLMPLDQAGPNHVSFFDNVKYKEQFKNTKAGACFVSSEAAKFAPENVVLLVHKAPYKAYALAAQRFYPDSKPEPAAVSDRAVIHETAKIGSDCAIEAGVVIGESAEIGDGCWIQAGAVIGSNVKIGNKCRIGPNASVSHAEIGDYVRLYPGACIGQDGFGFAIDPTGHVKVPQLGRVVIEDHVEIGANTTIDRGAGPDTVIGQGSWIDNLVQIGHNVKIGKGCIIVSQTGISGSTVLEDFVAVGGQVGIAGHLHIGAGARIAAKSGIMRDIPAGEEQMGYPALPIKQFMRQIATLNKLTKK